MQHAPTFNQLDNAISQAGFAFFRDGDYNLNLVGVRTDDVASDAFNDWLCVLFYTHGAPHCFCFPATTDPGVYWRKHPMNTDGTAVLAPGQHRGLWRLGQHQGRYKALVQHRAAPVYRDNNRDGVIDLAGDPVPGIYGINCHRARGTGVTENVDRFSAGCQVLADARDFKLLISLCEIAAPRFGDTFTYTLLNEAQL